MVEVSHINQLKFFNGFSENQLAKLSEIIESKFFNKGEQVHQKGDKAGKMFVVFEGSVSLREIDPGDEVGIAFEERERGDFFGSASFMEPRVYTLTAICQADTELLAIDADQLFALCQSDSVLGYTFMKKIAQIYFERYKTTKRQICQMVKTPTIITALPG